MKSINQVAGSHLTINRLSDNFNAELNYQLL